MVREEYGVDILCVQEIRGWESATSLPKAPAHVKGVINLLGTIVPLIDLRQCFGMSAVEYTSLTVVIVLKVQSEKGYRIMDIVVDAINSTQAITEIDAGYANALKLCQANVMLADNDLNITYLNDTVRSMMKDNEVEIKNITYIFSR